MAGPRWVAVMHSPGPTSFKLLIYLLGPDERHYVSENVRHQFFLQQGLSGANWQNFLSYHRTGVRV